MRAASLRNRVTIQLRTVTNTTGKQAESWADLASVWAKVKSLAGREAFYAAQTHAEATHELTLRYRSDIALSADDHRIKFGSRYFYLLEPPQNIDEGDKQWRFLAREAAA